MRALPLVLVLAACPGSGGEISHALEGMIEVKLEMRAAIDELKQASLALGEARAEIDRARGDLDRSRRALDKALERAATGEQAGDASLAAPTRPPLDPDLAAGITCAEEGLCTIKRSVIDALAEDPAALMRQARIVPSIKDGEAQGFKVYGTRPAGRGPGSPVPPHCQRSRPGDGDGGGRPVTWPPSRTGTRTSSAAAKGCALNFTGYPAA